VNARAAAAEAAIRLAAAGVNQDEAKFEAEVLVREAAGLTRTKYFTGADIDGDAAQTLERWVERRTAREPTPYITGHREFYGREFAVGPGVLVPRPETELLVELALAELQAEPGLVVAEAGTGSGAVAVSIAAERPGVTVLATDVSRDALGFAHVNALRWAAGTSVFLGDLLSAVRAADVVVANLPYIPTWEIEALEPEVSKWEPRIALDGGEDGFALIRRLVQDCAARVRPRLLALEVGYGQAEAVGAIVRAFGPEPWFVRDLAGIDRIVCARWV
jgi:release factor glutamine methyltransferase